MPKKNLGEQLADARRAAGLSQEEMGECVGASGRTVSTWETNAHLPTKRVQATIEALYAWPAGTIAHAIRTGKTLPAVTADLGPRPARAGAPEPSRAEVLRGVNDALETLTDRIQELENRVSTLEGPKKQTTRPRARAAR